MTNLEARGNRVADQIQNLYGLSHDEFINLWYETGCQYAEKFLAWHGSSPEAQQHALNAYIKSNVYWYWWATRYVSVSEIFLRSTFGDLARFKRYILVNVRQPTKAIFDAIMIESYQKLEHNSTHTL
jgi:hypothetical protein